MNNKLDKEQEKKDIDAKIEAFKKEDLEKYNPYQATKLPSKKVLSPFRDQVWAQFRDRVRTQIKDRVWAQVGDQVGAQVGGQLWDQVRDQVWAQVGGQVWGQVGGQLWDQVGGQVGGQVRGQVRGQVWATSYRGVKIALNLPIKHWFFDFLKLGVMIVFVKGKIKVFGKKGMYLGEYDDSEFELLK